MQYLRSLNENKAINDYFGDQLDALKEVDFQVEYVIFSGDTGVKRFALLRYYDSSILWIFGFNLILLACYGVVRISMISIKNHNF